MPRMENPTYSFRIRLYVANRRERGSPTSEEIRLLILGGHTRLRAGASNAVPCRLAAEAGDEEIHETSHLRREMPAGWIERM
jgi:hypothetical protein